MGARTNIAPSRCARILSVWQFKYDRIYEEKPGLALLEIRDLSSSGTRNRDLVREKLHQFSTICRILLCWNYEYDLTYKEKSGCAFRSYEKLPTPEFLTGSCEREPVSN